jgi:ABC-type transporter Mla maintaining outer membrane lipid asymmetry ATPase subunit MlaF
MNAPSDQTPAIELIDVAVSSGNVPERPVLEQVNWTIESRDFWVVGGLPNSGKSDLLATAAGLLRPLRGEHRIFGVPMTALSEGELVRHKSRIGLVFGNEGRLFNQLTVAENLALPFCYHHNCPVREVNEKVDAMLRHMELSEYATSTPAAISRTLRPRVALARALMLEPEVLLLDEPLRGMDPRQVRWWLEFLEQLARGHELTGGRPLTVAVTVDDLREWVVHATLFAVITGRRLLVLGGREQLKNHPEPLLQELLGHEFSV